MKATRAYRFRHKMKFTRNRIMASIINASEAVEYERSVGSERVGHIEALLEALHMGNDGHLIKPHEIVLLHKRMFPSWGGGIRNSLAFSSGNCHTYCDPSWIWPRLESLCSYYDSCDGWVEIAKSHIEFENVHPFPDGNGRIGRILVAYHCRLTDRGVSLIGPDRDHYLDLLESKDSYGLAEFLAARETELR